MILQQEAGYLSHGLSWPGSILNSHTRHVGQGLHTAHGDHHNKLLLGMITAGPHSNIPVRDYKQLPGEVESPGYCVEVE